jgi:hypothetical protein
VNLDGSSFFVLTCSGVHQLADEKKYEIGIPLFFLALPFLTGKQILSREFR